MYSWSDMLQLPPLGASAFIESNRTRSDAHTFEQMNAQLDQHEHTNTSETKIPEGPPEYNYNSNNNPDSNNTTRTLRPQQSPVMSIPDDVFRQEIFSLLPPSAVGASINAARTWSFAAKERLHRKIIKVPEEHHSINSALDEVKAMIKSGAPIDPPTIVVGPGKYLLHGGLLLIDQPNIKIVGTLKYDKKLNKMMKTTRVVGRTRVEGGATNVHMEDLAICNPRGAGIYCTGKNTKVYLKNCKVSGCSGNGIYARQGALCDMIDCNVSNNSSTGIAAWDPTTQLKIKDTLIHTNMGDGANASTGAALSFVGKTRIRSNSGSGLRTLDDDALITIAESITCDQRQTGNVVTETSQVA